MPLRIDRVALPVVKLMTARALPAIFREMTDFCSERMMHSHLKSFGLAIDAFELTAEERTVAVTRLLTAKGNPGVDTFVSQNGLYVC